MKILYQFSFSHFCEKARWALDYKKQPYIKKNLLVGPHVSVTKKLAPKSCVPIMVDEEVIIQESAAIIDYLDAQYPDKPLTPEDSSMAQEARDWEKYLDEEIGVTIRAWFYYHVLPDKQSALTQLLHESPWYGPPLYAVIFPKIRQVMMEKMNINNDSIREFEQRFTRAMMKINDIVSTQGFLAGNSFTRADLTACALLKDFFNPNEKFRKVLPAPVLELSQQYSGQAVYQWVNDIYRDYRI